MLAGREFEVKYYHSAVKTKAARRFEIVPQEIDGLTMPNEQFKPQIGDSYAVFHCMLPDAYICDNQTKTGASWDMFRAAVRYLFDNEEQKYTFSGELDGIWAKRIGRTSEDESASEVTFSFETSISKRRAFWFASRA